MGKKGDAKKAKVNVVTAEPAASDTPAVVDPPASVAAGPVAALNSVQQVQKEYSFNPDEEIGGEMPRRAMPPRKYE